ncbi:ComEA family DNA-binding protein [Lactococcus lactis]
MLVRKSSRHHRFSDENGDFKSLEDLGKVSGFGDKTLEKLKDELYFE